MAVARFGKSSTATHDSDRHSRDLLTSLAHQEQKLASLSNG
jgi:hypothetical protein